MSNPVAEIMDVFFNGRAAPKDPRPTIRVRVTRQQLDSLAAGDTLRFSAGGTIVLLSKTKEKQP